MTDEWQKTILLVEDEAIIAMAEALKINKFGYNVVTALTGESAIALATKDTTVDLVLMDIDLGRGMDGTQAAREILKQRSIPVIFLTAHAEREMVEKVRHITRYGYVIKNSGDFVLQSSIEMAFELFEAHRKTMLSEQKFYNAFHISPDSININRLEDGLYININQGFTELTGYTAEEVIGKTSLELNIWADPQDRARLIQGLRERGEVLDLEAPFRFKDGLVRIGLMSARIIPINGELYILSVTRDITERKRAETALREQETLYRQMFTEHAAVMLLIDPQNGDIVDANLAAQAFYGYTVERLRCMNIKEINMLPMEQLEEALRRAKAAGLNVFTFPHRLASGEVREVEVSSSPIQSGGRTLLYSIIHDVTERLVSKKR